MMINESQVKRLIASQLLAHDEHSETESRRPLHTLLPLLLPLYTVKDCT